MNASKLAAICTAGAGCWACLIGLWGFGLVMALVGGAWMFEGVDDD